MTRARLTSSDWIALALGFLLTVALGAVVINDLQTSIALSVILALAPLVPTGLRIAMRPSPRPAPPGPSVRSLLFGYEAALASIAFVLLSHWLLEQQQLTRGTRLAVSLLPLPAFGAWIVAQVWILARMDEFFRRIALETLAIAYPLALVVAYTFDILQGGGFVTDFDIGDALWPWMAATWVPAWLVALWRYR